MTAKEGNFIPVYHCPRCGDTIVCANIRLSYAQMRTRLSRMGEMSPVVAHTCRKFGEENQDAAPCELIGFKKIKEEVSNEDHAH